MPNAQELAAFLDEFLESRDFPDYPGALNGLQLASHGDVTRIAAAVDFSSRTVEGAISAGANFLIVHHGMFWGGAQRIAGPVYDRLRTLIESNIAVYSSHLPLDAHPTVGNNTLVASALELSPSGNFGSYDRVPIGVAGESDILTSALLARADAFARPLGGSARASRFDPAHRTRRWAILTGAGAGTREIEEARSRGVDTLIVGEGPHHTTVNAPDAGIVIIFAGHYATETVGVQALAKVASDRFAIPHDFLLLPTGS